MSGEMEMNQAKITFKSKEDFNPVCGSLMFPTDYRELSISDLCPKSYKKFRRDHNIKGRVKLLIHTGLDKSVKQNKVFKYKYPHVTSFDWDGAYMDGGFMVSDHPYGEVIVVQ